MKVRSPKEHAVYLGALRRLTPEARLAKAMELSSFSRDLFRQGLRQRFPNLPENQFHALLLKRLELCHHRNY